MKALLVVFLLLACFLLRPTQGIRLEKGFGEQQREEMMKRKQKSSSLLMNESSEDKLIQNSNGGVAVCKQGEQCDIKGYMSNVNTIQESEGNDKADKLPAGANSDDNQQQQQRNEERIKSGNYMMEDVTDMDYATARRKSPIHN